MGVGIGLVAAMHAKLPVTLLDASQAQLDRQLTFIDALLKKDVVKGKLTQEDSQATRERISVTTKIADLAASDFVIEAVAENVQLKQKLFAELSQVTGKECVLATNTSSISITKIAAACAKQDRAHSVIGMHVCFSLRISLI